MYKEHMRWYKVFKLVHVWGTAKSEKSEKSTESAVQSPPYKTGLHSLQKHHGFLLPVCSATQRQQYWYHICRMRNHHFPLRHQGTVKIGILLAEPIYNFQTHTTCKYASLCNQLPSQTALGRSKNKTWHSEIICSSAKSDSPKITTYPTHYFQHEKRHDCTSVCQTTKLYGSNTSI